MNIQPTTKNQVSHIYDPVKNIVVVMLAGVLTPQIITQSLEWLYSHLEQIQQIDTVYFDFQDVTHFGLDSFVTDPDIYKQQHLIHLLDELPIVYIVNNLYQEYLMRRLLDILPNQAEHPGIVIGWADKLSPVTDSSKTHPEIMLKTLNIPRVSGYYDNDRDIIYSHYYGSVTPNDILEVLQWKMVLFEVYQLKECRGRICDFRTATRLLPQNHTRINQIFRSLDMKHQFSRLPSAMIATNDKQARVVSERLRLTEESGAQRFTSLDDAYQFIADFHKKEAHS